MTLKKLSNIFKFQFPYLKNDDENVFTHRIYMRIIEIMYINNCRVPGIKSSIKLKNDAGSREKLF